MAALLAGLASSGSVQKQYIDEIFSAYTYQGNGSTQTIVNGIDLAGKGGMVWGKARADGYDHQVLSSALGGKNPLSTDLNASPAGFGIYGTGLTFNSNGFTLGSDMIFLMNSGHPFISWTFRNAAKFFKVAVVTKSSGSNTTVDLSSLGTVGMVRVKRTDAAGSWYVWHRSLSAGKLLIGETTAAEATLGHITVSGTTLTLVNGVIADGTYHVEAYAHDTSADGLIQCGSFTTDASGNATVNLGWEPQYILFKRTDAGGEEWKIADMSRGLTANTGAQPTLWANLSNAEGNASFGAVTATGFKATSSLSASISFLAIRRPNKPPTSGTQVYNAIARTGTGAAATVTGVGFAPDLLFAKCRLNVFDWLLGDRLRGTGVLLTDSTSAEGPTGTYITGFEQNGVGVTSNMAINDTSYTYINHFFKRAHGVFDTVCYTGTGVAHTEAHGLGVVPELWIVKSRLVVHPWEVGNGNNFINLNSDGAASVDNGVFWGNGVYTAPTSTQITVSGDARVNGATETYVAYLFASKPGISCVTSFIGNGTTQNINCGFAAGARFVLIKATSSAGNWNIGDSTRGIVAGNDPLLCLNTTAAEVTSDDWLDPYAAGFTVNETASAHANTNGVSYLVLAIA